MKFKLNKVKLGHNDHDKINLIWLLPKFANCEAIKFGAVKTVLLP